jgi:inner membrane protein
MDNLCHSLVGAALAECGLRRRTRYATFALVIGANLPDVDVLSLFGDDGLGFRRGITHGIPALVVWPFVLTGLVLFWHRLAPRAPRPAPVPKELLKISALAILTHPTLDWMNTYGMRWLMPFDGRWFSADALFIIDPWLYLMLGAAWIVGAADRRSGGAPDRRERFARGMVGLATVYIVAMMGLSQIGKQIATRELGLEDATRRDLMIAPVFLDSWRRLVTARVDGEYRFGEMDWRNREVRLHPTPMPPQLGLLEGATRTEQLESLLDWARFPFARREGDLLHVDDARYAGRGGRSFAGVTIP